MSVEALDNGLGHIPPMGWNTVTDFPCNDHNETLIKEMADKMVELGLDKLGYKYISLDDCWDTADRDLDSGNLTIKTTRSWNSRRK